MWGKSQGVVLPLSMKLITKQTQPKTRHLFQSDCLLLHEVFFPNLAISHFYYMISFFKLTDAISLIETYLLSFRHLRCFWPLQRSEHSIRTISADAANSLETVSCCIWATADMRHLFQISCDLLGSCLFFFLFFGSNFSEKKKHVTLAAKFLHSNKFQDSSSICNNDSYPLFQHLPSGQRFKIPRFKTKEQLCSFCYCSLTLSDAFALLY